QHRTVTDHRDCRRTLSSSRDLSGPVNESSQQRCFATYSVVEVEATASTSSASLMVWYGAAFDAFDRHEEGDIVTIAISADDYPLTRHRGRVVKAMDC
ncbi:hypothetical protein THAOC_01848, partial [Thalassiosira oceanica]